MQDVPVCLSLVLASIKYFLTDTSFRLQGAARDPVLGGGWREGWEGKVRLRPTTLFMGSDGEVTVGCRFPRDLKVGAQLHGVRLLCPSGDPEVGPYDLVRLHYGPPRLFVTQGRVLEILDGACLVLSGRARGAGGQEIPHWTGLVSPTGRTLFRREDGRLLSGPALPSGLGPGDLVRSAGIDYPGGSIRYGPYALVHLHVVAGSPTCLPQG